jgi:transcriptional regulator
MTTGSQRADVLQGTLALMILQTLRTLGPQHGYGIARRIEQVSGDAIALNQGTLYPALVRLEQDGLIKAKWGVSDNNRKAKFYSITRRGERQLAIETEKWSRVAGVIDRFLTVPSRVPGGDR